MGLPANKVNLILSYLKHIHTVNTSLYIVIVVHVRVLLSVDVIGLGVSPCYRLFIDIDDYIFEVLNLRRIGKAQFH